MANWLRRIFLVFTLLGTPFFYVPLAVVLATFNFAAAVKLAIILVAAEAFCGILKFIYPKERPVPMPRKTFYQKYEAGSFPSIHSARIAAVTTFFSLQYPHTATIVVGVLASLIVGYSRVYLRKHYITDVIAGILIGTINGIGLGMIFP